MNAKWRDMLSPPSMGEPIEAPKVVMKGGVYHVGNERERERDVIIVFKGQI